MLEQLEEISDYDSDATYIEEGELASADFVATDSDSVESIGSLQWYSTDNDELENDEWDYDIDNEDGNDSEHSEQNMENYVASDGEEFSTHGSDDSSGTEVSVTSSTSNSRQNNPEPVNASSSFSMELRPRRTRRRIIDVQTNGGEPEIMLQVTNHVNAVLQLDEENSELVDQNQLQHNDARLGPPLLAVINEPSEGSPVREVDGIEVISTSNQIVSQNASEQPTENVNGLESHSVRNSETIEKSDNDHKKGKRSFEDSFNGSDDGMTCSICMDSYTNAGLHRLTSLSCGHLFGQSCIERWLMVGCHGSARRCPTCNKKASKKDIRIIYAKKLVAVDTSEIERVKQLLEKTQAEKNRLELDCARMSLNLCMKDDEIKNLKKMLSEMKETVREEKLLMSECGSQTTQSLSAMQLIELNKEGGCRVMVFNKQLKTLLVSQKSPNPLFPGFGIRKIDTSDFRPGPFFFLHPKTIRDMAVHPQECDLLLSVSLDGTAKLLDVSANVIAQTYHGTIPLWSCCWDSGNPNMLFTGSQNGVITQYDKRQTSSSVNTWVLQSDHTPVVSLASIPPTVGSVFPHGGFLSCRLTSVCAFQQIDGAYIYQPLPIEGPFMSMCYNEATQQILTSSRPTSRFPTTRHTVNQLATVGCAELCNPIHTFNGSRHAKLMSRSCIMASPDDYWVVAQNESEQAIDVWSIGSGKKVYNLSAKELALDLCPVYLHDEHFLFAVSEKGISLYKL